MTSSADQPNPPFGLDRLDTPARRFWDEYFSGPLEPGEKMPIRVYSFAQACALDLAGTGIKWVPEVVQEYLECEDPDDKIGRYLRNMAEAHGSSAGPDPRGERPSPEDRKLSPGEGLAILRPPKRRSDP